MKIIYPDLEWASTESERKGLPTRCPYATVHRCPRYYESVRLLSDVGITVKMPEKLNETLQQRWKKHELWPATAEAAASASGGEKINCFSNFCPEASFEIFKLFASLLIEFSDGIDRQNRERYLIEEGTQSNKDWRWSWEHVEPMHYSDCPLYSMLRQEKTMTNINFNAPVSGQINVAGTTVDAPVMNISVGELLTRIEDADATTEEKEAAKSKLAELLEHPLVAAIVGGLVGAISG
ncbi:hypothetical protein [Mariprofundus ferrooxydans]|uniref:hypothetical protein n=1 Tax=Mariprofundus ferrooxydans TaxID=314344 RepID=UPI00142F4FE8|nr:hypothetical protein [Mariprofundus ferrooxydans]